MKTNAMQVAERIEGVLASEQWSAILDSTSTRMRPGDTRSFELKEALAHGTLSFIFNYELGDKGLFLSTYDGKFRSGESVQNGLKDKAAIRIERTFNAEGRYVFSFREAINLLQGRSVLKSYVSMDGVERDGWFKASTGSKSKPLQFFFSGGQSILPCYDLNSILQKMPMVAGHLEQMGGLIRSLQSGDQRQIVLNGNGKEEACYIQADPATKSVAILDDKRNLMSIQQLKGGSELANPRKIKSRGLSTGL